jgi:pilus assembly protein CpaD
MFSSKKNSTAARLTGTSLVFVTGLLLSGCVMDAAELDDSYVPVTSAERYPIRVAEAPVKMNVNAKSGSLRAEQMNSVVGFAQDARNTASSRITVSYASSSGNARNVAQQTIQVLVDQGIPRSMIATGSYHGSGAMVTLSFQRKVAVTTECGDWSENLQGNQSNSTYPNQGCALQQNIAAMVANPEDFETPRAMSPAYVSARMTPMKKYYAGDWTSPIAPTSSSSSSSSSDPVSTGSN